MECPYCGRWMKMKIEMYKKHNYQGIKLTPIKLKDKGGKIIKSFFNLKDCEPYDMHKIIKIAGGAK